MKAESRISKSKDSKKIWNKSKKLKVNPTEENKDLNIELKKADENERYDNDPITYQKRIKEIEAEKKREELNDTIREYGFAYSLSDFCCKCLNCLSLDSEGMKKKKMYFYNGDSILDYYLDVVTYFKKMIEIEIIKYYIFTKDERKIVSVISNPDLANTDKDNIIRKINLEYSSKYDKVVSKMEDNLKNVLQDARNKSSTNKLLQLVQMGNDKLIDTADIIT